MCSLKATGLDCRRDIWEGRMALMLWDQARGGVGAVGANYSPFHRFPPSVGASNRGLSVRSQPIVAARRCPSTFRDVERRVSAFCLRGYHEYTAQNCGGSGTPFLRKEAHGRVEVAYRRLLSGSGRRPTRRRAPIALMSSASASSSASCASCRISHRAGFMMLGMYVIAIW